MLVHFIFFKESPHKKCMVSTKILSRAIVIKIFFIRMISERSCDTEYWGNDAENSALITGINYI